MSSLIAVYHCALHNEQGSTGGRFSGVASAAAGEITATIAGIMVIDSSSHHLVL